MKEVVFNTLQQAEAQQTKDFQLVYDATPAGKYKEIITKWANPRQRLDGKWAYPCAPGQDYSELIIEDYDEANYEQFDIMTLIED